MSVAYEKLSKIIIVLNYFRPGMYTVKKKVGITFQHSFGGRVKMLRGVDLKCCSINTDTCKMCGKRQTGDYWHLNNKIFLCRACMTKEFQEQAKFKKKELELFHVSFMQHLNNFYICYL